MVLKQFAIALSLIFFSSFSNASVLQEGWYKIVSGGQHVGFIALRYEFDEAKKQFVSTSFTQTGALAGNLKESLVATSSQQLDPVSYQFTSTIGQLTKTIDSSFSKNVMSAKMNEAGKTTSIQNKLEKGTFLSQFLIYVILQNPKGLKVGNKFAYSAIAEEDGKIYQGEAYVSGMEKVNGIDAYKILNTFKGAKYVNFVTPKGLIILTKDPVQSLSTEMVGNPDEATKGFDVNRKTISLLFKTLPTSTLPAAAAEPTPPTPAKTEPVKLGDGSLNPVSADPTPDSVPKGLSVPPGKGTTNGK